ncbi:hypothetical protein [Prevotella sp. 10(H)]|uniref:hypothetical protein n=1 Tax=Prevotella sp. 10(H) TaxID=1158294 RepID=UPI000689400D|nr:hypothetical protein [Prevotella sp. 10(H)]
MKSVLYFTIVTLSLTACNQNKNNVPKSDPVIESTLDISQAEDTNSIELTDIEGYFSVKKVTEPEVMILNNQPDFDKHFKPAKTMDNRISMVDFDMQKAGAIVLPETKNEVTISLDSSYLVDKTLNITYSIMQESTDRSFTIIPLKIFAFDSTIGIDTVVFHNGNNIQKFSIK